MKLEDVLVEQVEWSKSRAGMKYFGTNDVPGYEFRPFYFHPQQLPNLLPDDRITVVVDESFTVTEVL
jgi:hypothetical protein